jgi:hypothetical protein
MMRPMRRRSGLLIAVTAAFMLVGCGRTALYEFDAGCPEGAHCLNPPDLLAGHPRDMSLEPPGDMRRHGDLNSACGSSIPCTDARCVDDPACVPAGREICTNGLDDDDDGLVDCADPDCRDLPICRPRDGGTDMPTSCFDGAGNPQCDRPECATLPECLHLTCSPEIHFGTVSAHDYDQTRTFDTRGAVAEYKTCAFPGGTARVGEFTLTSTADVRLDFAQPRGAAHVVTLNRAGFDQLCDDNQFFCLQADQAPSQTHTFAQLAPGTYYVIVQSFPGTQGATTVRLSTGRTTSPEVCDNGIDDDGNGLIDCADQACVNAANCVDVTCKPEKNLGALVVGDAPKGVDVNSRNTSNRFHPTCAGTSAGNDYVVRFTLHETAGVLVDWSQFSGDHVISIFNTPPPGVACDGAGQTSCYWTMGGSGGSVAFSPRPPGDYIFIIKAHDRQSMGTMHLNVSAYANRQQEICTNGIDDDGNGFIDCADEACFGVGSCKPPICVPDVDLGSFDWSTQRSTSVDTRTGVDYYTARCAQGGGKSRVVRLTLTQPMGLGYDCDESGSHVLQLTQRVQPLDACDANPVNCADPTVLPFGCNFIMPGLQPGTYELLVQAFSPGKEGVVNLTLFGVQERSQELCDNGVDDNGDGKVDCADPACFTSPLCQRFVCSADKSLGLLPLDGSIKSTTVQTADNGDKFKSSCSSAVGGQDAVVDFSLPARSDVTIEWAQGGNHTFALYPNVNDSAACNAGTAVNCTPSAGQFTGSYTLKNVPGGKYHLILDADKPGSEGGAVLQISARPAS